MSHRLLKERLEKAIAYLPRFLSPDDANKTPPKASERRSVTLARVGEVFEGAISKKWYMRNPRHTRRVRFSDPVILSSSATPTTTVPVERKNSEFPSILKDSNGKRRSILKKVSLGNCDLDIPSLIGEARNRLEAEDEMEWSHLRTPGVRQLEGDVRGSELDEDNALLLY